MMRGHFRYSVWDPFLIISQILTIQAIFYLSLGVCIFLTDVISGYSQSLDQIFLYKEIQVKDLHGRCLAGSFIINSLCGFWPHEFRNTVEWGSLLEEISGYNYRSLALWYFVQRTKLCLDFTVTAHLIHLILCWSYSRSFPSTLSWWLLSIIDVTIMCVCGEFLCMRTEMKSIPLSMGAKADL